MTNKIAAATEDARSPWTERVSQRRLYRCAVTALVLLWPSLCGAGAPITAKRPSAEELVGAMFAGIEGASTGIVHVDVDRSDTRNATPVRTSYVVSFDDSKKLLRCDRTGRSRSTKYIRTPAESIFQLASEPNAAALHIFPPDRDLSATDDRALDPHLLWLGGTAPFLFRPPYASLSQRLRDLFVGATVSTDDEGRWRLTSNRRILKDSVEVKETFTLDPRRGYVPVRHELALEGVGSGKTTIDELSEMRYEQADSCFLPVALRVHAKDGLNIEVTCRWENVNTPIDLKAFTIEGLEAKSGTPIRDFRGPEPVVVGFIGSVAPPVLGSSKVAFWRTKPGQLLICNVVLLAMIICYLGWRRVGRKGAR
jgi:hypothetical protein